LHKQKGRLMKPDRFLPPFFAVWIVALIAQGANRPNVVVMIAMIWAVGCELPVPDIVKTPTWTGWRRWGEVHIGVRDGAAVRAVAGGFFTGQYQERFGFVNNAGGIPTACRCCGGIS